jgi:hypothetical protein
MVVDGLLIDRSHYAIYTFPHLRLSLAGIYLGSYFLGRRVLHKDPPMFLTMKEQRRRRRPAYDASRGPVPPGYAPFGRELF